jgi:hypothetical protein
LWWPTAASAPLKKRPFQQSPASCKGAGFFVGDVPIIETTKGTNGSKGENREFCLGLDFVDFRGFRDLSCPAVEVCHFPTFHHPPRFLKRKGGVGSFLAVSGEKPKSLFSKIPFDGLGVEAQ